MGRAALVAAVVGVLVSAGAPTVAAESSQEAVVSVDCSHTTIQTQPPEIGVSCDRTFKFYDIRWRHWGSRVAVGIGRARLQGCTPACANGQVTRPRATLRVTHLVTFQGIRWYGHLAYVLAGPLPSEYHRHRGAFSTLPIPE